MGSHAYCSIGRRPVALFPPSYCTVGAYLPVRLQHPSYAMRQALHKQCTQAQRGTEAERLQGRAHSTCMAQREARCTVQHGRKASLVRRQGVHPSRRAQTARTAARPGGGGCGVCLRERQSVVEKVSGLLVGELRSHSNCVSTGANSARTHARREQAWRAGHSRGGSLANETGPHMDTGGL
jgi:hypothetical protein